ncbi:MAG: hypothetical protein ACPGVG_18930 [Mycobacterium sp.]
MTPFQAVALPALTLITRIIEMRLEHYKVNPELRKQDAANAEIWGKWGQRVLKALEKMGEELGLG